MRAAAWLVAAGVLVAVGVAQAPSVHTGGSTATSELADLELSRDGIHWSRGLETPLVGAGVWVPGDSRTAAFWVRGTTSAPVTLVVSAAGPIERFATTDLRVQARAGTGPWTPRTEPARLRLLAGGALGGEHGQRVEVRASVEPQSGNVTMSRPIDLTFAVDLVPEQTAVVTRRSGFTLGWGSWGLAGGASTALLIGLGRRRRHPGASRG